MSFRIVGLEPEPFLPLFALDDAALAERGVQRVQVADFPAAPCRIALDDAPVGSHALLLNYAHQPADTPYKQQGPIFVTETRRRVAEAGFVPPALARRMLSLRAFDAGHMMIDADLVDGAAADTLIERLFANRDVTYIHAHYARRGCFAAAIERD